MSELRTSAVGLLQYANDGSLVYRIAEQLRMSGHGVGQAERRSCERSLPILAQDLVDAGLGQVEILVEYQLPLTSMRVDAVLAGVHLTRGMRGTMLYSTDSETQEYLAKLIDVRRHPETAHAGGSSGPDPRCKSR